MSIINLYNSDCLDAMKKMPDKKYKLAIVDPPYGIERFKRGGSHVNKYGDETRAWNNIKPNKCYFDELFRVSVTQIIWGANNFELPPQEGFIIWDKVNAEKLSFAMCEMAYTNFKRPAKIFRYNSMLECNDRIHATQKPVKLYEWLLLNYAKEGDNILDTHGGSMSIAIACHNLGFDLDLYEIDKDYFEAGKKRLETHKLQQTLF